MHSGVSQTCAGMCAGAGTTQGQRELIFELGGAWGGGLQNVFHIFCFPSTSADRTSVWAAFYWSQTTNSALCQVFIPLSSILLFCLSPSMHFYCLPPFPSCNNLFFTFIPSLFPCPLLHFHWFLPCFWPVSPCSPCLISSELSNGSLGSFPYTTSFFLFPPLSIQTSWLFHLQQWVMWSKTPRFFNGTRFWCSNPHRSSRLLQ